MLTIRREQLQVLGFSQLEAWMVRHVETYFPAHCRALGSEGVRKTVRDAMAAGQMFGFAQAELAQFVDLTFLFGTNFQSNPRYPWAADILSDNEIANPQHRMERLYGTALDFLHSLAAAASRG